MPCRDLTLGIALALLAAGCGKDAPKQEPAAPAGRAHEALVAPHGGTILELGEETAHVELVHDTKTGTLTLYVYGKDLKSPAAVLAPTILLASKDGPKEIRTTALDAGASGTATSWKATDPALSIDPLDGRLRITVAGKPYQVPLEPSGHDHK